MNNLYFWKSWNKPHKQLYLFLLSLFLFTLALLAYAFFTGGDQVVKWEVESELQPVKVVIDQFARNLFNFTVESDSYYALDKYVTTEAQANLVYAYLFLVLITVAMVFIITTFSFLDLYWFMAGMLGFLLFLFSMKFDVLQLFGRIDSLPVIVIFLVFGSVGFVFNSYYKAASYLLRLVVYTVLTALTALVVYKYSYVATPFLYLANFGSLFPVIVAMIFVFTVGYDIVKGLLYIVAGNKLSASKNTLMNFIFASLLYLVNVLLLLLKKLYLLDLNIVYLNPFLLLAVSAVIGIWMFRKRTEMFSAVLPFAPAGAYVYLSLAIITFAGAGYALINGNTGMIEVYERIIAYGHLFFGFVFVVYVIANFGSLFDKISVYENVYKPERMTFLVVPAMGIVIATFFFLYQKKYPYHLAMSGYYTYAGDVMTHEANYPLAFEYYKEAVLFDYPNQRANYSIAALSALLDDKETAKGYYENSLVRDPSPQAYIGLSNVYMETGELFQALFNTQEGLKKFPKEGRLYNNLAVLYFKTNLADSAVYFLLKSQQYAETKPVAASNILYVLAKKNLIEVADSLIQSENYPENISYVNNKLALLNQMGKRSTEPFDKSFVTDTVINANVYAYLVNSNINSLKDTASLLTSIIDTVKGKTANERFKESLVCQRALRKYYSGNRFEAIQDLLLLKAVSSQTADYPTLLASWMLEQEQYHLAAEYYKEALLLGKKDIELNYAFASIMDGQPDDALFVLSQLQDREDHLFSNTIELINLKDAAKIYTLEEPRRLQWFLYHLSSLTPETAQRLYESFTNAVVKVYAGAALCRYYIEKEELVKAQEIFTSIQAIQNINPFALRERNYTFLLLKTREKEGATLKQNSTLPLNSDKEILRNFFIGAAYAYTGDSVQACVYYLKTLKEAPYQETVIPLAVRYLSQHNRQQEAYDYLVEIVQNDPSVPMQKAYLELCLDMALVSYAESTLDGLKGRISAAEFAAYQDRFQVIQNQ